MDPTRLAGKKNQNDIENKQSYPQPAYLNNNLALKTGLFIIDLLSWQFLIGAAEAVLESAAMNHFI